MKIDVNGEERYIDGYLHENISLIKQAVDLKWDGIVYVGGYEGDGKSVFAAQYCKFVDPSFDLSRCVFTPKQFIDAVDKAEPGQAIQYDEAQDVFESTNRDKTSRIIKSKMTRIRKNRLHIVIVAPDFWRINKYLFIHRSRAFLRIYSTGLDRGYFEFYNRERKHELMIKGKRTETLCVSPNFRGRFTGWFPFDEAEYDKKKEESTQTITLDGKNRSEKQVIADTLARIHNYLMTDMYIAGRKEFSIKRLCQVVGISHDSAYKARKSLENGVFESDSGSEHDNTNLGGVWS